ncbi:hypothetical protein EDF62_3096 [Leucobacter luti]|uniref:Uncharacterized protein n=1 Tax=Leucobacter luti TaxID=340320 RepID=A0A4V3CXD3_9MICO|nr:hypothetical protein [Leucobacter luti]TDP89798.1 hypothetical protein EDF62_3096 [Leucobacter luti]
MKRSFESPEFGPVTYMHSTPIAFFQAGQVLEGVDEAWLGSGQPLTFEEVWRLEQELRAENRL